MPAMKTYRTNDMNKCIVTDFEWVDVENVSLENEKKKNFSTNIMFFSLPENVWMVKPVHKLHFS